MRYPNAGGARKERPVAEPTDGQARTYSEEEYGALVAEREALTAKRDELLTETKRAKDRLKAFDGVDPEEFRSLKAKLAEIETAEKAGKAGLTSEQLEKLRAEVRQSLENEYAPFRSRADELAQENRALKLDNVVKQEMAKSGVLPTRIDSLFRLTADRYELTDDGAPMLKDRAGVEIGKYIKDDLLKEYPEWFEGSGASGGGASRSTAGGGGQARMVSASDNAAVVANLDGIAKGTVQVRQ